MSWRRSVVKERNILIRKSAKRPENCTIWYFFQIRIYNKWKCYHHQHHCAKMWPLGMSSHKKYERKKEGTLYYIGIEKKEEKKLLSKTTSSFIATFWQFLDENFFFPNALKVMIFAMIDFKTLKRHQFTLDHFI